MDRSVGYSVREIMTPIADLECWTGTEAKRAALVQKAEEYDYTYIPVKRKGVITGLITKDALNKKGQPQSITVDWLIAADTTVLHLIGLFAQQNHNERRIFLVLQSSQIVGLVSPADLNHIAARASVYLLVAHFEVSLANLIRHVLKGEEKRYTPYIPADHLKHAEALRQKGKKGDISLDLLNYVYLS